MLSKSIRSYVNLARPDRWKNDIVMSVDMYNRWFMDFAPSAYRQTRIKVTDEVEGTLHRTGNLTNISVELLKANPEVLPTLRMSTCPPLAVDRLVGLSGVSKNSTNQERINFPEESIIPTSRRDQ